MVKSEVSNSVVRQNYNRLNSYANVKVVCVCLP